MDERQALRAEVEVEGADLVAASYDARGRYLATAHRSGRVALRDPASAQVLRWCEASTSSALVTMGWHGDQITALTADFDVLRWDIRGAAPATAWSMRSGSLGSPVSSRICAAALDPGCRRLAYVCDETGHVPEASTIWVIDLVRRKVEIALDWSHFFSVRDVGEVDHIAFSSDGRLLAASGIDSYYSADWESLSSVALVNIWQWEAAGQATPLCSCHVDAVDGLDNPVTPIAFTPDARWLWITGISAWAVPLPQDGPTLEPIDNDDFALDDWSDWEVVATSAAGDMLAGGDDDLRLYSLGELSTPGPDELASFLASTAPRGLERPRFGEPLKAVSFDPSGRWLAAASASRVKVWALS